MSTPQEQLSAADNQQESLTPGQIEDLREDKETRQKLANGENLTKFPDGNNVSRDVYVATLFPEYGGENPDGSIPPRLLTPERKKFERLMREE